MGLSEKLACLNNFVRGVVVLKQIMHCKQLPKLISPVITKLWNYFLLAKKRRAGEFHNQSHLPGLKAYYKISDCRGGNWIGKVSVLII